MAKTQGKKFKFTYNMALVIICLVLFVAFGLIKINFFSMTYIIDVLKMAVEIGIMVLPLTALVICGCIDFSMCAVLSLTAVVGGLVTINTNAVLGVLAGAVLGTLCALVSGGSLPVSRDLARLDAPFCLFIILLALIPALIKQKTSKTTGAVLLISYTK